MKAPNKFSIVVAVGLVLLLVFLASLGTGAVDFSALRGKG